MRNYLRTFFVTVAACLFIAGCGGGGAGTPAPIGPTQALNFSVAWQTRTRSITATSSASSVVLTIPKATAGGGDFKFVANRDNVLGSHIQTFTATQRILPGKYFVTVKYFTDPDGGGAEVGWGGMDFDTTYQTINVTENCLADKIVADSNQVVTPANSPLQLTCTVYTASGAVLAVSPGSIDWVIDTPVYYYPFTSTVFGEVTYAFNGKNNVYAVVDGIRSNEVEVVATH